jgi:hypothetical protein
MRQDPIEIAMAGACAGKQSTIRGSRLASIGIIAPGVVDEAFAHFAASEHHKSQHSPGERRLMKQSLVSDLAVQLEAIDRQRARLAQLLHSIENHSIDE